MAGRAGWGDHRVGSDVPSLNAPSKKLQRRKAAINAIPKLDPVHRSNDNGQPG